MIHVVGPRGRLAKSFIEHLVRTGDEYTLVPTHDAFNLTRLSEFDAVINFAARGVLSEERTKSLEEMKLINVELASKIGFSCMESGTLLIQLSSQLTKTNTSPNSYIETKREAATRLLNMSEMGLNLACLALPSIVGFRDRKGHIEKVIARSLLQGANFENYNQINRGVIHRHDFNWILNEVIRQKWKSKREISVAPLNHITFSMIQQEADSFLKNGRFQETLIDYSDKPQIRFLDSMINFVGMSSQNLIRLMIYDEVRE